PDDVAKAIELYGDDDESMMRWGVEFAIRQVRDLAASGVNCFHMYTLNRDYPVRQVMKGLK
ncbi:MAG: methylenetetrahydrofolate reductase, partial [Candidatus Omnitrophica bacterium]|nr:methylenetetrahydrofolate reductase [Candidatus Omnitrophota bacterium]